MQPGPRVHAFWRTLAVIASTRRSPPRASGLSALLTGRPVVRFTIMVLVDEYEAVSSPFQDLISRA